MFNWLRLLAFSAITALVVLPSQAAMATGKPGPFHIYMAVWRGCEDACKGFQDYFRDNKIPATFTVIRSSNNGANQRAGTVNKINGHTK